MGRQRPDVVEVTHRADDKFGTTAGWRRPGRGPQTSTSAELGRRSYRVMGQHACETSEISTSASGRHLREADRPGVQAVRRDVNVGMKSLAPVRTFSNGKAMPYEPESGSSRPASGTGQPTFEEGGGALELADHGGGNPRLQKQDKSGCESRQNGAQLKSVAVRKETPCKVHAEYIRNYRPLLRMAEMKFEAPDQWQFARRQELRSPRATSKMAHTSKPGRVQTGDHRHAHGRAVQEQGA